jgi:energy-coupling factor transporter ATP-binding protein EcfA2
MPIDPDLKRRLAGQLSRGELILFTGAGFSGDAHNADDQPIPGAPELRDALWHLAFPGESVDETAQLGEVFECAVRTTRNATRDLLRQRLTAAPTRLNPVYRTWFSMPWHRVYTVNLDDVADASGRQWKLPRRIVNHSALSDPLPAASQDLEVVHLNGRVRDYPNVTFSPRQYAERVARPDPWYVTLANELVSHPVVFVGTQLNEPTFWYHLEMRRAKARGDREMRPGSYLVAPSITLPKRVILDELNITWIEADAASFATQVLATLDTEAKQGLGALAEKSGIGKTVLIRRVSDLRTQRVSDHADYLMGREPRFDDLVDGYAVARDFESGLPDQLLTGSSRVMAVTGTSGSGKSTTLMRIALTLQAAGHDVGWVDPVVLTSAERVRHVVRASTHDVVVVDNIDRFGHDAPDLLKDLPVVGRPRFLLCSARGTLLERLGIDVVLRDIGAMLIDIPHLSDADIQRLIDALDQANRLGRLKGLGTAARVQEFRSHYNRQLLVAMIEATSGEKFDEKVRRECRDLEGDAALMYCAIGITTILGSWLTREEALVCAGLPSNEGLNQVQSLLNQHLVVMAGVFGLRVRHSVVADLVVEHFRSENQLAEPLRGLIFTLATKVGPRSHREQREARLLRSVMSHEWLLGKLPVLEARRVLADVEQILSWNYHYWLQRGSIEVEQGDLQLADNFLAQAESLAPADTRVRVELAYLALKRAAVSVDPGSRHSEAMAALDDLEEVIDLTGGRDRHPYDVMGRQGLRWVRAAGLPDDERGRVLGRLRAVLDCTALKMRRQKRLTWASSF